MKTFDVFEAGEVEPIARVSLVNPSSIDGENQSYVQTYLTNHIGVGEYRAVEVDLDAEVAV